MDGPTRRPRADLWPLDAILVGVGTLRVAREIFRRPVGPYGEGWRAWDLATSAGVSEEGTRKALERLRRAGLVERIPPRRRDRAAEYRIDRAHPYHEPLARLFSIEAGEARHAGFQRYRRPPPPTAAP